MATTGGPVLDDEDEPAEEEGDEEDGSPPLYECAIANDDEVLECNAPRSRRREEDDKKEEEGAPYGGGDAQGIEKGSCPPAIGKGPSSAARQCREPKQAMLEAGLLLLGGLATVEAMDNNHATAAAQTRTKKTRAGSESGKDLSHDHGHGGGGGGEHPHLRRKYEWWTMGRQQWLGGGVGGKSWSTKGAPDMFFEATLRNQGRPSYYKQGWYHDGLTRSRLDGYGKRGDDGSILVDPRRDGSANNTTKDGRLEKEPPSVRERAIQRLWNDAMDRGRVMAEAAAAEAAGRAFFGGGGGGGGAAGGFGGGSVTSGATLGDLRETIWLGTGMRPSEISSLPLEAARGGLGNLSGVTGAGALFAWQTMIFPAVPVTVSKERLEKALRRNLFASPNAIEMETRAAVLMDDQQQEENKKEEEDGPEEKGGSDGVGARRQQSQSSAAAKPHRQRQRRRDKRRRQLFGGVSKGGTPNGHTGTGGLVSIFDHGLSVTAKDVQSGAICFGSSSVDAFSSKSFATAAAQKRHRSSDALGGGDDGSNNAMSSEDEDAVLLVTAAKAEVAAADEIQYLALVHADSDEGRLGEAEEMLGGVVATRDAAVKAVMEVLFGDGTAAVETTGGLGTGNDDDDDEEEEEEDDDEKNEKKGNGSRDGSSTVIVRVGHVRKRRKKRFQRRDEVALQMLVCSIKRSIAYTRRRLGEIQRKIGGRRRFKNAGDLFRQAEDEDGVAQAFSDLARGKA